MGLLCGRDARNVRPYNCGDPHSSGEKMAATKVTVNHNGSIRIEGDFEIVDPEGRPFGLAGRTAIGLCRCGQSANKPFCDGSHKACGFADIVAARELPAPKPKV
jgi:CDGSH-type Zn-finger protein